jgi:hypothetical protein
MPIQFFPSIVKKETLIGVITLTLRPVSSKISLI